jgi:serine/threonine-protein kinase
MQFGRYRVVRTLGSGAMGEVYEAVDDVLGRDVAIKTLKGEKGALLLDERFKLEARAIAQLSHPGVVQVFDIDLAAEPPYLVMERVPGPSLAEKIKAGTIASADVVPLGIQIARALAAAHAANIVHRDVKPANVLAAGPGAWKLADFGVAHVPDSSLTITGQFMGSPAYAPPEALVKGTVSPAGDVYGLGATLYEAAAGRWPRRDAGGALLAPVPPLRELAPQLPAHVCAAIDRATALEAAQRPTAAELADLLATPTESSQSLPAARRWKWWWPVAAGGALLIVLAIAFGSSKSGGGSPSQPDVVTPPSAPPVESPEAARDWNKIVDDVRKGHYGPARHHLDEFEERYGETDESRTLRDQLPDDPGPPGKRKRGKHED